MDLYPSALSAGNLYALPESSECRRRGGGPGPGVSCPSVTRMLGILTQRGLLERERYGKIHLTDQGLVLARTFSRKVALVTERLPRMELALAEEELYQAACLLAAALPDHVVDAAPIPSPTPRTESATVPPPPSDPASDPADRVPVPVVLPPRHRQSEPDAAVKHRDPVTGAHHRPKPEIFLLVRLRGVGPV